MISKLLSLINIFGKKDSSIFLLIIFFSLISGVLDLVGIGLLAVFALLVNDPSVFLDKIFIDEIRIYLKKFDKLDLIIFCSISILFLFIIKHLILFFTYFIEIKIIKKITKNLKEKIYKFYLSRDYQYFLENNKSDLINIISTQTHSFMGYIYNVLIICKELILILIIFLGMVFVDWQIILSLTAILFVLTFFFTKIFKKKLNEIGSKSRILQENEIKHLGETYQSIKLIKLEKKENFFLDFLNSIVKKKNYYEIIHYLIGKIPKIYLEIIILFLFMGMVIVLINRDPYNQAFFGMITFFAFAVIRILPAFISLNNAYTGLAFFRSPFEIIYEKIKNINFDEFITEPNNYETDLDKVKVENLKFDYINSKKIVLDNINFSLNKDDRLGIIGSSGSGKSTLLYLLAGLLEPTKGKVIFNKTEVKGNKNYLKNKISYLPQDSFILDTSIKENIAFGEVNSDDEKIRYCIDVSNLKNFIEELPNKINTLVGESGSKLSHGQKQRLGLARALYSNPDLLIIDEGLNALDYKNEEEILKRITSDHSGMIVFVSHRIESLRYCNKLLIIESGKIKDFGLKDELIVKHKDLQKYFEI